MLGIKITKTIIIARLDNTPMYFKGKLLGHSSQTIPHEGYTKEYSVFLTEDGLYVIAKCCDTPTRMEPVCEVFYSIDPGVVIRRLRDPETHKIDPVAVEALTLAAACDANIDREFREWIHIRVS